MSGMVADEPHYATSPLSLTLSHKGRGGRFALRVDYELDSLFRENDGRVGGAKTS